MRLMPLLAVSTLLFVPGALGQSLKSDEIVSSIVVRPVSTPNPVLGADDRVHLAYELFVVNPSKLFVTLDKVEAVDNGGRSLWAREGDGLGTITQTYAGTGRTLSPGGSAVVLMDVSFAASEQLPPDVTARVTATRQAAGPDGKPVPMAKDSPFESTYTFAAANTTIGESAVVLEPPLAGKGWIAVNGCCDSITSHRGAVLAINGQLRVPERFAIDWVKLDDTGRIFTGDGSKLASYAYYGTPVHAAADGVVVNLYDDADEQVPGADAKGITTENVGGNMLVIDIGGGAFAFYAHMQRGSLKVKLGDRVKVGQVIGLLGNTGNSTAPHLHFHVMDGPSPLDANGLPYVFSHFSSPGVLAPGGDDAVEQGEPAKIEKRLDGTHVNELPLNNQVVDFN
ncbi:MULTISPECIES: M23 family metallopeptidase [unclassified Rhizobium]|uniref:M23 family metallopeptidase n=1 Tax=unclassified Rhizobium TaxID=2613769 RepID=UPI0009F1BA50|nr:MULTISPECIES: M23 family metallopeptidase [unclassified Rhizobium]MDM9621574.1 M23 family metallopeptidase [Rhizobium sp. S96]